MTNTGWNYAIEVRSYNAQQTQRAQQLAPVQPQPAYQPQTQEAVLRTSQSADVTPRQAEALEALNSSPRAVFDYVQSNLPRNATRAEVAHMVEQTMATVERVKAQIEASHGRDVPIVPGFEGPTRALLEQYQQQNGQQQGNDPLLQVAAFETARVKQQEELESRRRLNPAPSAQPPINYNAVVYQPTESNGLADMLDHAFNNVPTFNANGGPNRGGQGVA